jgi:hypothetical protein
MRSAGLKKAGESEANPNGEVLASSMYLSESQIKSRLKNKRLVKRIAGIQITCRAISPEQGDESVAQSKVLCIAV